MSVRDSSMPSGSTPPERGGGGGLTRRMLVRATGALGVGGVLGAAGFGGLRFMEGFARASTFVARVPSYEVDLEDPLLRGLAEIGITRREIRGTSVLVKPNLVEPSPDAPHINTHPTLIRAVAQVFRRLDAASVQIAEGAGHCRDTHLVLEQSGLERVLREDDLPFTDLNHADAEPVPNAGRFTKLDRLYLPRVLRETDWVVSLPKLKTHHWAGVTLSMKNLFGVMPGLVYGWPKNVLHYQGIHASILDIAATLRPGIAIIDGIVGMEGDGPIMGTPRQAGVLVLGRNLPAVDATGARLMGFDPLRIPYLSAASGFLGPVKARHIEQRGEPLRDLVQDFGLPAHPHFDAFRAARASGG